MGDVVHAQAQQRFARAADDLAVAVVDPGEVPGVVAHGDAGAGLVEHRRQLRRAGAQRHFGAGVDDRHPGQLGRLLDQPPLVLGEGVGPVVVDRQHCLQPAVAQQRDVQRGGQVEAGRQRLLASVQQGLAGDVLAHHRAAGTQHGQQFPAEVPVVVAADHRAAVAHVGLAYLEGGVVAVVLAVEHPRGAQGLAEPAQGDVLDLFGLADRRQGLAEFEEERLAPLELHPLGSLGDDAQHAADRAVRLAHRGIGNVEIDGLAEAVALYIEGTVPGGEGLAGLQHAAQQRFEVVPQLGPVLDAGPAQGAGVLGADGRRIGIVVQRHQLGAPEHHDLRAGRQHGGHQDLQGGRPAGGWPEGRIAPVAFLQQRVDRPVMAGGTRMSDGGSVWGDSGEQLHGLGAGEAR